ncbi:LON peptidase substrate-binding domain-containing protein [bacterium]|nr:LON peptidase substrate-binding domain-containing protein [bacterium]
MDLKFNLSDFSGQAPVFPLPHVVQFPKTMLPLHIFEERYQAMLETALDGEKMIAMGVLKPGWEENYSGNPDLYSTVCLGSIVQHEPMEDGRSNIILYGLSRAKIQKIITPRPFRTAKIQLLKDQYDGLNPDSLEDKKKRILELYGEFVIEFADNGVNYPTLSDADFSLGSLTDAVSAVLGLNAENMVYLLEELNVDKRAQFIIRCLQEKMKTHFSPPYKPVSSSYILPNLNQIHLN